jgi:YQGE family putative transporter
VSTESDRAAPLPARTLHPKAKIAMLLQAMFSAAEALCAIFVSVYLWANSHDFGVVFKHYLAIYTVTPFVFILAGWYSQARDRLHVYRLGLVLFAIYYATMLALRERTPEFVIPLGILQGITWGVFYAGSNTLDFDVTTRGRREYYFGLVTVATQTTAFALPLLSGFIISRAPTELDGYHRVFAISVAIYLACFAVSFLMPNDREPRPFRLKRALFPGKDQRDWRLLMLASASLSGTFSIFGFLLSLLMFIQTDNAVKVGGFAAVQSLIIIVMAYYLGRTIVPRNRRKALLAGVAALVAAGTMILVFKISATTLLVFGLLRAISGPLFSIPHSGLRMEIILKCAENPEQRIEYICAWEVPLAIGRIIMMLIMIGLYGWLHENELGLRLMLFMLCAVRVLTYNLLIRTDAMRDAEKDGV